MASDAHSALNRLGMGARPGEVSQIGADPRGWILAQINAEAARMDPPPIGFTKERVIAALEAMPADTTNVWNYVKSAIDPTGLIYDSENRTRMARHIETDTPFAERWVIFWSNHLSVSGHILAESYERDVIREHAFGNIRQLLLNSAIHPAMLDYLDNARSIGPNSVIGQQGYGLNENYARELLELHTMGVDGGYSQDDIIELAKILTGWTIDTEPKIFRPYGGFFYDLIHEPNAKSLLGETISESGRNETRDALEVIVTHPATARFIARKIATHFVSDTPPDDLVDYLAHIFAKFGGDLKKLAEALIDHDATWDETARKLKTPLDFVVSALRGVGVDRLRDGGIYGDASYAMVREMGQANWSAPSPAGWPDQAADWNHASAFMQRAEFARRLPAYIEETIDVATLASELLGSDLDSDLLNDINQRTWNQALSLLIASPDFQWRT